MKNKVKGGAKFSLIGYFLFLLPISVIIGLAIGIYKYASAQISNQTVIAVIIIGFILVATLVFSLIDIYRRRVMVDRPVAQILEATRRISVGDFSVRLMPLHSYYKYDDYDKIMENINKMASELSKSEILKSEFISNVSHEIKTPLSVISSYAKLLESDNLDKETKQKYLKNLVKSSEKLSNLITNILKLNKLENQKITEAKEEINIGENLRECVLQYEELFEKKEINLNCDISDIMFTVEPSYIEIIFNNLVSNAIKFSNKKGKIDISLKEENESIIFRVTDNGLGMSREVGERIFEKFYQGDTSHSSEGNGLGLALVKQVIDILGGEIKVESEQEKGSTFTVKLKRK